MDLYRGERIAAQLPASRGRRGYRTLATDFYEDIKHDIIACKLRPGEMIYQQALIERYRASKTPLREALKLLTQDGLIQPLPSRGYLVAPITVEDVRALFDARQILETAVVERVVKIATDEQLTALEGLAREPHVLLTDDAAVRWTLANLEFHENLAALSGNNRLVHLLRHVLQDLSRAFVLHWTVGGRRDGGATLQSHLQIVESLRSRDLALARSMVEKGLRSSLASIEGTLAASVTTQP